MPRIALIYDDQPRPETTGVYCLRALQRLGHVEHFRPQDVDRIPRTGFDLYLNIDDGLRYRLPQELRPSAWWVIDTHLDPAWAAEKGRDFDWLFAAQRDGAERLNSAGLPAVWLPLACDPEIHRPHSLAKRWDVAFVGRLSPGPRHELLEIVLREFPKSVVGQAYFDDLATTYSRARIGFNRSVKNDVNMRVFETLGCGTLLVTNDLADNGQDELLVPDRHLVTYADADELLDKLRYYLTHEEDRDRIAQAGHAEVIDRHTYLHRMQTLLEIVFPSVALLPSRAHLSQSDPCHLVWQVKKIRRLEESTQPVRPLPPGVAGEEDSHGDHDSNAVESIVTLEPTQGDQFSSNRCPVPGSPGRNPNSQISVDQIDFIIKTFLRPQALLRLLGSILDFYPQAQVSIADDGGLRESPDNDSRACCELIDSNDRFILHSLPFATGVTPGRNLLVDKTDQPFLLLLDDDFCFTAETKIERFMERLAADPEVGVVAGACIDVIGKERRQRSSGGTFTIEHDTLVIDTAGWRDRAAGLRDYVPHFALIRREVFRDVRWEGALGGEHYDFCLQLQHSPWNVVHDLTVRVDHHHFTPSLAGYVARRANYVEGQQWLLQKWNLRRIVQDGNVIIERQLKNEEPAFSREAQPSAMAELSVVSWQLSVAS